MQGYGQGGQPPGFPPGPPGGGNPPQDWQVQPPMAQPPAPGGYGPPAAPAPGGYGPQAAPPAQQPFGQPGGFAPPPAAPQGYGQPAAPPGYGTQPAGPPMGPGTGHYEFNETENQTVNKLAGRLMIAGIMEIVFGVLSLFGNFNWGAGSGVLGLPGSIAMIVIGAVFIGASGSFKKISQTQGNDMGHLMEALNKMSLAATVQIVGYIAATVLFVVGLVLVIFLWAAIVALFALR